jgi:CheY-like chemotaxis protein
LGLAVVQRIIKNHGGAITVYSEPERGTTFQVFFPRFEGQLTAEPEAHETLPRGSEQILFVDDEPVLVDMGREMLESLGYRIVGKTNSLEALQTFCSRPEAFDLVITDMTMPGMGGTELAKELMTARPGIPIILCTGFSEFINCEEIRELGIRELLMKPYVISDLAKTIRIVLGKP